MPTTYPAPSRQEIPAGKIRLCEYADADRADMAQVEVFETRAGDFGKVYRLLVSSPGWECAGSVLRWTNGYYAVRITEPSGSFGGRQFKTLDEARALFESWAQS
jgi:hypothetical protein